jgi:hypothetical protein
VAISHGCRGVAARACGLVNLEPTRVSASSVSWCLVLKIYLASVKVHVDCSPSFHQFVLLVLLVGA